MTDISKFRNLRRVSHIDISLESGEVLSIGFATFPTVGDDTCYVYDDELAGKTLFILAERGASQLSLGDNVRSISPVVSFDFDQNKWVADAE